MDLVVHQPTVPAAIYRIITAQPIQTTRQVDSLPIVHRAILPVPGPEQHSIMTGCISQYTVVITAEHGVLVPRVILIHRIMVYLPVWFVMSIVRAKWTANIEGGPDIVITAMLVTVAILMVGNNILNSLVK